MTYPLVETFYSLQGEGYNSGKAFYFIRLAGCNVGCPWCDTKESWNSTRFQQVTSEELISEISKHDKTAALITGGEPLLHDLEDLSYKLHQCGIYTALETSGIGIFTGNFDWITLSPKKHSPPQNEIIFSKAHELKVVINERDDIEFAEEMSKKVTSSCLLFLQPQWTNSQHIISDIVEYIKLNPTWRLSLQMHKYVGVR